MFRKSWILGNYETDPEKPQHVPCLTCLSRPWFVKAKRDMTGVEALIYQGWERADIDPNGHGFKDQSLLHLAGNAMNAYSLVDVFYSAFMFLDVREVSEITERKKPTIDEAGPAEIDPPARRSTTIDSQSPCPPGGLDSDSQEELW